MSPESPVDRIRTSLLHAGAALTGTPPGDALEGDG